MEMLAKFEWFRKHSENSNNSENTWQIFNAAKMDFSFFRAINKISATLSNFALNKKLLKSEKLKNLEIWVKMK